MKWMVSIAVGMFFVLALSFMLAEQAGWMDEQRVSSFIYSIQETPGGLLWAGVAIAGLLAVDLFLPVPSSILMILSGAVLGFHIGWMVSLSGAMGSALIGFGFCRKWGKPAFERMIKPGEPERITRFFEQYGIWAILLSRSVPMLTEVISCLAGLSAMSFRLFAGVALAGTAPLCIVYAWAGYRAMEESAVGWAVLLAFVVPAVGLGVWKWLRFRASVLPRTRPTRSTGLSP
jgi:uncharacterized membrane protein YdjX (TVP38/TMEM64 family)